VKEPIVNTFGFAFHLVLSNSQLCCCSTKAAILNVEVNGCDHSPIILYYKVDGRLDWACGLQFANIWLSIIFFFYYLSMLFYVLVVHCFYYQGLFYGLNISVLLLIGIWAVSNFFDY
jgi:hypothetical protein